MKYLMVMAIVLAATVELAKAAETNFSAYDLRCENLTEPMGIEKIKPRFSWKCYATVRNFKQGSYRILVASSPENLTESTADLWDSGWVKDSESLMINYEGKELEPNTEYFWTVAISDAKGLKSCYSRLTSFTTGLHDDADWHEAKWLALEPDTSLIVPHFDAPYAKRSFSDGTIGQYTLPIFRKEFIANLTGLKSARAYVCGLGQFELFVNGHKAGNHFLDPGWTRYDKDAQYVSFNITDLLTDSVNTLGVMLGNGFYNIPNERYYKN